MAKKRGGSKPAQQSPASVTEPAVEKSTSETTGEASASQASENSAKVETSEAQQPETFSSAPQETLETELPETDKVQDLEVDASEVREKLAPYFEAYPEEKEFHITSDGQVFLNRNKREAADHQKHLDSTKPLVSFSRTNA